MEVEVPEGFEVDEKTLARMIRASVERKLFLPQRLEELVPGPLASEEEIMDIDRVIKRSLARRLEHESPTNSSGHQISSWQRFSGQERLGDSSSPCHQYF